MISFGFSYVGLIYLIMLFVPNIIWAKHKPEGYDEAAVKENKILLLFERTGEVLLTCLALIFRDTAVHLHPGKRQDKPGYPVPSRRADDSRRISVVQIHKRPHR